MVIIFIIDKLTLVWKRKDCANLVVFAKVDVTIKLIKITKHLYFEVLGTILDERNSQITLIIAERITFQTY